jgi:hypothetical protein
MYTKFLRCWMVLSKLEDRSRLEAWAKELEARCARPPRLGWHQVSGSMLVERLGEQVAVGETELDYQAIVGGVTSL